MTATGLIVALLAGGAAESAEARLTQCAWRQVPATAATLVAKAKFDARYRYDAEGSPTVGPLMRVRAACRAEQRDAGAGATPAGTYVQFDDRKFLKILRDTQPKEVGSDVWTGVVRRCEFRFSDAAAATRPAGITWRFRSADEEHELSSSEEIFGFALSQAELSAALSKGKAGSIFDRLDAEKPVRVASEEAGKAQGKPYAVDFATAPSTCQTINSDGSYTDAQG